MGSSQIVVISQDTTVTTFIFIILCNAPTITHGDVKLQINYFDLFMCFLQVIITMILLFFKYVYRFGTVLIQEIT